MKYGRNKISTKKKRLLKGSKTREDIENLYKARQAAIDFPDKITSRTSEAGRQARQAASGLKILTPKQMLQRLPIALAQIKADNNSESLLNEIRQIVYSLYQSKEVTKKVYNNIIKLINVEYKNGYYFYELRKYQNF